MKLEAPRLWFFKNRCRYAVYRAGEGLKSIAIARLRRGSVPPGHSVGHVCATGRRTIPLRQAFMKNHHSWEPEGRDPNCPPAYRE